MRIVLSKDLLQVLFPGAAHSAADSDEVEDTLREYYEQGPISVSVESNPAEVRIEITQTGSQISERRLKEASEAGEAGDFRKAERLLQPIREQYPWE